VFSIPGAGKKAVNLQMDTAITKFLIMILPILLANITPTLREHLVLFVGELEKKAKQTASPYDDMLVAVLKAVLSI
jgi:hypothetical protein